MFHSIQLSFGRRKARGILVIQEMKRFFTRLGAALCAAACAVFVGLEARQAALRVQSGDQNGDGRPDIWRHYDAHGQLARVDIDSNFDGSPDIQEYYDGGVLIRRESDRDFNGQADLVEEFDALTHHQVRSVVDVDYDGTADLLVFFRDGHPVFSKRTAAPQAPSLPVALTAARQLKQTGDLVRLNEPLDGDGAFRGSKTGAFDAMTIGPPASVALPRPISVALHVLAPRRFVAFSNFAPSSPASLRSSAPRAPPAF
jgi:hypothetical protein